MQKNLIIPLETKARDLDSRLLIGLKYLSLPDSGKSSVLIGYYKEIGSLMLGGDFSPYVFLANGLTRSSIYFERIYKSGGTCMILDEEGGIDSEYSRTRQPRGGKRDPHHQYVSHTFFWGENSCNTQLADNPTLKRARTSVVGNPRFDISKPFFRDYFDALNKHNHLNWPEYILIDTAFGAANPLVPLKLELDYFDYDRTTKSEILDYAEYERTIEYPLFVEAIKKLAGSLPTHKFVLRPHPVENVQTYVDIFATYPNILVTNDGPAQQWFPRASMFIHTFPACTTALEAFFFGLDPVCFIADPNHLHVQRLPLSISTLVSTPDDLVRYISTELTDKSSASLGERSHHLGRLRRHIDNVSYSAAESIAEFIMKYSVIERQNEEGDYQNTDGLSINRNPRNLAYRTWHFVRNTVRQFTLRRAREAMVHRNRVKFNYLKLEELQERCKLFRRIDNSISSVKIEQLAANSFKISR